MKRLAFLLLFLAAPAFGQSVKLPAEVKVDPKEWAVVPFEADGGPTRWMMPDGGLKEINLEALLGKETAEKSRVRIFKATKPGRYRVWAVTGKIRDSSPAGGPAIVDVSVPAECVIVVGETPPPPPVPPEPPPPPPPPAPSDPLFATLAAAYKADGSPQAQAKQLASIYRVSAASTVNDTSITTIGDLYATVAKAAGALVPLPALRAARQAVAAELSTKLPTAPATALDASTRKICSNQFSRMAALLEAVSK